MSFSSSAGALVHMRNMKKKHKEDDDERELEEVVNRIAERLGRRDSSVSK